MPTVGSADAPLRVAIVGAGPAGFYTAERLLKQKDLVVSVDLFDRLPTPYGLVRGGVAPDHQKIKSVTKVFDRTAANPNFRYFGNVAYGRDLHLDDLRRHYHQFVFAVGAQTDRRLNIPGIDLAGSHSATEFVAWYNGHPDFRHCAFDLSQEDVAVIGVGNVAVDVARILCRTAAELATTDIADYALAALRESRVKRVTMLGRRGPAQAAFTPPEVKELGELPGADTLVPPDEAVLDPLSVAALTDGADRGTMRKVEIIQELAARQPSGRPRALTIRFLVSPTELIGDASGRVSALRLVRNELYATEAGTLRPRATDEAEILPAGLVFRSIGYRGVPLEGIPFNDKWGVILNEGGRVVDPDRRRPMVGAYVSGWIKRGPSGVIGTNKPDATETVEKMLADLAAGRILDPPAPSPEAALALVAERQPRYVSFVDWQRLDAIEVARGAAQSRPRVKFTDIDAMLAAIAHETAAASEGA